MEIIVIISLAVILILGILAAIKNSKKLFMIASILGAAVVVAGQVYDGSYTIAITMAIAFSIVLTVMFKGWK